MSKLSSDMSLEDFDKGYWYAEDLKAFVKSLGVRGAGRLRKDELEKLIKHFLKTGELEKAVRKKKSGPRDIDLGLHRDLPVKHYTSNRETKDFLLREARKLEPDFKVKSGTRYLLNRWREAQENITYGDLVQEMMRLSREHDGPLRIEHARYNNFVADFFEDKAGTLEEAIAAWRQLKDQDCPKTYGAWKDLGL